MSLDLSSLAKGISSLDAALRVTQSRNYAQFSEEEKRVIKAGVIQNFEFTYELCWKYMRRWLEVNVGRSYSEGVARRELFRLARENHLIMDVEAWMRYHEARNNTSHAYDTERAEEVFDISSVFLSDAKKLLLELERRND